MKVLKSREIVIEYERVQLIRKHARTHVVRCAGCRAEADFVAIADAAGLFNTNVGPLATFIAKHGCHIQTDSGGRIFVCIGSLLAHLRQKSDGRKLLIGAKEGDENDRI